MHTLPHPLAAHGLCFAHDGDDVLHDVSVSLARGAVTAIAGPNGAGKSTLVELLAGVRNPRVGTVERHGSVALVVQRPTVPDSLPLTVADVVAMGTWSRRRPRAEVRAAVLDAVARVRLSGLERRSFSELSGGQRQRTLIAQGIVQGADILLLDEPASGLDAESRETTRSILATEAAERGTTVACVTHDEASIAVADHVCYLVDGRRAS